MLKKRITEQDLINKIGDYSIFNYYFGEFKFGKHYPSIFRRDRNPSTGFFVSSSGRIIYNDLSNRESYGVISFVMKLFNISFKQAIEKIASDFGLTEQKALKELPKIYTFDVSKVKSEKIIRVGTEKWKQYHLDYWKQFSITETELNDNFVYPVKTLYIDNWAVPNNKNELRFAYKVNYKNVSTLKIYSPYDPIYKWTSSTPNDHLFGWDELPFKSDTLIITKGQKDRIIWKKFFTDVLATQNESSGALKAEDIIFLQERYKKIYINFDCDKAGKEGAEYFTQFNWEPIFVPDVYYEQDKIKDFADLVKSKGLKMMQAYLKWKNIL
jgi:hypothetical protein